MVSNKIVYNIKLVFKTLLLIVGFFTLTTYYILVLEWVVNQDGTKTQLLTRAGLITFLYLGIISWPGISILEKQIK